MRAILHPFVLIFLADYCPTIAAVFGPRCEPQVNSSVVQSIAVDVIHIDPSRSLHDQAVEAPRSTLWSGFVRYGVIGPAPRLDCPVVLGGNAHISRVDDRDQTARQRDVSDIAGYDWGPGTHRPPPNITTARQAARMAMVVNM